MKRVVFVLETLYSLYVIELEFLHFTQIKFVH
jgi:hypothetical protein